MLKNYLTSAFRNLLRQKGYSFINIAGLTIGLACCMLIVQYVVFQTTFDAFHEHGDDLYRLTISETRNGETTRQAMIGHAPAPIFADDAPEILHYSRIHPEYFAAVVTYEGRTFKEEHAMFVDSTFLEMFTFPLRRGDPATVLRQPNTILLTESAAERYFGSEDPIGKTLEYTGWIDGDYTVAGILEDVPARSHLKFDFLLPMRDLLASQQYMTEGYGWVLQNFMAYVQLREGTAPDGVERKLTETVYRHQSDDIEARNASVAVGLQPVRAIHLDDETAGGAQGTDPNTIYFFSIVAVVTLVIALINYVNLATARAMDRAREVGVRKVVGAHRRQLMGQFLLESILTNLAALLLALGLAIAATPTVNQFAGTELGPSTWSSGWFIGIFFGVFVLGVLLSGLYPAFVLSSFRPASVLKGSSKLFGGRTGLRKTLVTAQFAASIVLLIGTGVVVSQVRYMRNHDVGLELDQVLVVSGPRVFADGADRTIALRTFAEEIGSLSAVSSFTFSSAVPGRGFDWYSQARLATADPSTIRPSRAATIDHRFLDLYGLELTAGQPFIENMAPPAEGQAQPVLINGTFVDVLGISSDEDALHRLIAMGGAEFEVQGVVEDFNWSSLHQASEAVMFIYGPVASSVSLKVSATNLPATIEEVRNRYEALFPGNPFEYTFADAAFAEQYRNDERFARLFGTFAALAILIACLGLFGLAAFTAETRTKEIGVRKVLGASVANIVALLSRDFLMLVGIALVIAVPIAWYVMNGWLSDFAYQIELGPGIFLLAGATTMLIALLTVSYKSVRVAMRDPVQSLRYE